MHHVTSHPALARPTPPSRSRSSSAIGRVSCHDLAVEVACAIRPEVIIVGAHHNPPAPSKPKTHSCRDR
ncbi:MAG: hypothetical protein WKF75_19425 [Singulisphaera sp.]